MPRTLLLLLALACRTEPQPQDWRALADAWRHPDPLPDFALVDASGEPFRLHRHAEDWLLVGFVFTRCPSADACPLTMTKMVAVQEAWTPQPGRPDLHLLALTLDPGYDTPELLRAWGEGFGVDPARFTLATGPVGLTDDALPTLFNVLALPDADEGVRHSVKVALLRPGLALEAEWKENDFSTEDVLRRVLSENPPTEN